MDFERVLLAIGHFLDETQTPWALAGAMALAGHGLPRLTNDLDFAVCEQCQGAVVAQLESIGYRTLYRSQGFSNHQHPSAEWGNVDFIYVEPATADRLFGEALRIELLRRPVLIPKAEHLIAMKVHAMKNAPERVFREMADIQSLMSLPGLNEQLIRSYFERAGLLDRYEQIKRTD